MYAKRHSMVEEQMRGICKMKRAVVTGMGVVTPIGIGVSEFWDGILHNRIGIDRIRNFDASEYKVKLSAEVKNFNAKDYLEPKAAKRMERFSQFAAVAAKEAMEDSGIGTG